MHEGNLLCLDCHTGLKGHHAVLHEHFGMASGLEAKTASNMTTVWVFCADVVPGTEDVGERAAVLDRRSFYWRFTGLLWQGGLPAGA